MAKSKDLRGNSSVQMRAEGKIRELLKNEFGNSIEPQEIILREGEATVTVDATNADRTVFVEIFARQGPLKSGQKQKLAKDILKLGLLKNEFPNSKGIVAFANPSIAGHLSSNSWLSKAMNLLGIEQRNLFDDLPDEIKAEILKAQRTQQRKYEKS